MPVFSSIAAFDMEGWEIAGPKSALEVTVCPVSGLRVAVSRYPSLVSLILTTLPAEAVKPPVPEIPTMFPVGVLWIV